MLALLEYFWDWGSTSTAPVTSPPPTTPGRGSGKNHGHNRSFLDGYIPMSEDEWENRAQNIREDKPKPLFDTTPFGKKLEGPTLVLDQEVANMLDALTAEHTALMQNMPNLPSVAELKAAAIRLRAIDAEIPSLKKRLYKYLPAKFT
jgi:hypothetical protein